MSDEELFALALRFRQEGVPSALATIIHTKGHTPREVGSKMLVLADGRTYGTIGGGCGESEVKMRAISVLDDGQPVIQLVDLMDDPALVESMVCGGKMEVFIQPVR